MYDPTHSVATGGGAVNAPIPYSVLQERLAAAEERAIVWERVATGLQAEVNQKNALIADLFEQREELADVEVENVSLKAEIREIDQAYEDDWQAMVQQCATLLDVSPKEVPNVVAKVCEVIDDRDAIVRSQRDEIASLQTQSWSKDRELERLRGVDAENKTLHQSNERLRARNQKILMIAEDKVMNPGQRCTAIVLECEYDLEPGQWTPICTETLARKLGGEVKEYKDGRKKASNANQVGQHLEDMCTLGYLEREDVRDSRIITLPSDREGHQPVEREIMGPSYIYRLTGLPLPGQRYTREEAKALETRAKAERTRAEQRRIACTHCGKGKLTPTGYACEACGTTMSREEAEEAGALLDARERAVMQNGRLADPETGRIFDPETGKEQQPDAPVADEVVQDAPVPDSGTPTDGDLRYRNPVRADDPACTTCGAELSPTDKRQDYAECSRCRVKSKRYGQAAVVA